MRFIVLTSLLTAALLGALPAQAQEPLEPEALLRAWYTSQADVLDDVTWFAATERATWTLDGPFGAREMAMHARVSGKPGQDGWDRTIEQILVNGQPVAPERWRRMQRRRRHLAGPDAEVLTQHVLQLPHLIRWMEPVAPPHEDLLDEQPHWRFDLAPERRRARVERLTLWLTPDGHLRRSRALLSPRRPPRRDAPFVVTTDYARVQGLDVPAHRHIEGIVQQRRRERSFSMLFDYTATYSDHEVTRLPRD